MFPEVFDLSLPPPKRRWIPFLFATLLAPQGGLADETKGRANWTFLVYAAGDEKDIDPGMRSAIDQITSAFRSAQPADKVSLAVEFDSYQAAPGNDPVEADSGDPRHLYRFLDRATRESAANRYVLLLLGHAWGVGGVLQDFNTGAGNSTLGSIMPTYMLGETLRHFFAVDQTRAEPQVPRGKFDALLFDACITASLDVMLEIAHVADYLGGSAIETPYHSLPYRNILGTFLGASPDLAIEQRLLRPWVEGFVTAHLRHQEQARLEGEISATHYAIVRSAELAALNLALQQDVAELVQGPNALPRQHVRASLAPWLDADGYVDIGVLASVLRLHRTGPLVATGGQAGIDRSDPTTRTIRLDHDQAKGVMVYLPLEVVRHDGLDEAACNALKALVTHNDPRLSSKIDGIRGFVPPRIWRGDIITNLQRENLDLPRTFCSDLKDPEGSHAGRELSVAPEAPPTWQAWDRIMGRHPIEWSHGTRAWLRRPPPGGTTGRIAIWLPAAPVGLHHGAAPDSGVHVRFRPQVLGAGRLEAEFFALPESEDPAALLDVPSPLNHGSVTLGLPAAFFSFRPDGLFAAVGHSTATHFKRGLSVLLDPPQETLSAHFSGPKSWARVRKETQHGLSSVLEYLDVLADPERKAEFDVTGHDFYLQHRIAATLGPIWLGPKSSEQ